jgi:hypothetical protein
MLRALCLSLFLIGPQALAQMTHIGVPASQTVVLEAVITSPTERKWTLLIGGRIQPTQASKTFRIHPDKKFVLTDMKFTLRGQPGKSANVGLAVKEGLQDFTFYRLTIRMLAGLDTNVHSEHFTAPIVLAEDSELYAGLTSSSGGVSLESVLLYGYFIPLAK